MTSNQPSPPTDVRNDALRLLSSGVYVLTVCAADTLHAATVTWVSQVSIQPPLVMVALRRNSRLAHAVRQAHRFAVNVLEAGQEALAQKFFAHWSAPVGGADLAGHAVRPTPGRCPLLTDAPAWLECRLTAELTTPGDHTLLVGEILSSGVRRAAPPMILGQTPWSYGNIPDN
jgi:flavin reductase (DIM6/NTAB) family NADH-FMN oxidoreductase RutF